MTCLIFTRFSSNTEAWIKMNRIYYIPAAPVCSIKKKKSLNAKGKSNELPKGGLCHNFSQIRFVIVIITFISN